MRNSVIHRALVCIALLVPVAAGCGGDSEDSSAAGGSGGSAGNNNGGSGNSTGGSNAGQGGSSSGGCSLDENTTKTTRESPSGCAILERDTSACKAERESQRLSGVWLQFSCRVTLEKVEQNGAQFVKATSDNLPDYFSNYFEDTDACHEDYSGAIQNPNLIAEQDINILFPLATTTAGDPMVGDVVGMALNGVVIFGNFAAPGDDIYQEAMTFDRCGAHPQNTGKYHYHAEPYSLSYDDSNFIGVMSDGYAIYGRKDADGSYPTLDEYGGHTGTTADSESEVYHYHVNEQTSTSTYTKGQKQWFLTKGSYRGSTAQ